VLSLPEDMLTQEVAPAPARPPGAAATTGAVAPQDAARFVQAALASPKTVLILGGSGWTDPARADIVRFVEAHDVPTVLSFRRKDLIDNDHPNFVGDLGLGPNPKLIAMLKEADRIIAVGARLGENPSQAYGLFTPQDTAAKLMHIHPDPEELNRVWPTAAAMIAEVAAAANWLGDVQAVVPEGRAACRAQARAAYEAWTKPVAVTGAVNMSEVVAHLNEVLPADAILTNGAGNYAAWLHRFIKHRAGGRQIAPTSGAMGYGVPAAIAAKIIHHDRTVVCFAGDGCFMMSAQELATAIQHDAAVIFVVVDNGSYGTIRMHQERHYPGRVSGTELTNPDFAAFARAFGAFAVTVERTEDFPAAFAQAQAAGRAALIHIKTSLDDISPGRTIAALRSGG
jgi:acetolactate synthase-1/2/3 large subunit